jgi:hypothetical protein
MVPAPGCIDMGSPLRMLYFLHFPFSLYIIVTFHYYTHVHFV